MYLAFIYAAAGLNLEELPPVALTGTSTRLTAVLDGSVVAVVGPESVVLIDPVSLETLANVPRGARAVLARDADGDGASELWLCAPDGVWRVPWPELGTVGDPVSVLADACLDFAPLPGGLVVANGAVGFWVDDGAGGLVDAGVSWVVDLGAEPLFAFDGAEVLAGSRGDAQLHQLTVDAYTARVARGEVGGLGLGLDLRFWTVPSLALLEDEHGRTTALAPDAGPVVLADLDGDGTDEVVVGHPDRLGVVDAAWESEVTFPVDGWGDSIVVVPGGDCAEVWGLGDGGTTLRRAVVTDCRAEADDDGDGWTRGGGDCDDTDPSVHPDAAQGCDEVDHDCDGVGDASQVFGGEIAVWEGTQFYFSLPDACDASTDLTATESPETASAYCGENDDGRFCIVYDQGVVTLRVAVRSATGLLGERDLEVTAINVPPVLRDGSPTSFGAVAGETGTWGVPPRDPGADTVTIVLNGAPRGLVVEDARILRWTPDADDVGTHAFSLVLSDEDGGRSEFPVTITVSTASEDPPTDTGCGCCGGATAAPLAFVWASRRRRRASAPSG